MESHAPPRSLCATCRNLSTCTYVQSFPRPILHCDEYDLSNSPVEAGSAGHSSAPGHASRHEATGLTSDEPLGLCRNCEGRHACTFPKPEGGVWRCEEYR